MMKAKDILKKAIVEGEDIKLSTIYRARYLYPEGHPLHLKAAGKDGTALLFHPDEVRRWMGEKRKNKPLSTCPTLIDSIDPEALITTKDAAELLGISPSNMGKHIYSGSQSDFLQENAIRRGGLLFWKVSTIREFRERIQGKKKVDG